MKKPKERSFLVVYQEETDGAILIASKTQAEIRKWRATFDDTDFAIFDGVCLKTFDEPVDFWRLKRARRNE